MQCLWAAGNRITLLVLRSSASWRVPSSDRASGFARSLGSSCFSARGDRSPACPRAEIRRIATSGEGARRGDGRPAGLDPSARSHPAHRCASVEVRGRPGRGPGGGAGVAHRRFDPQDPDPATVAGPTRRKFSSSETRGRLRPQRHLPGRTRGVGRRCRNDRRHAVVSCRYSRPAR